MAQCTDCDARIEYQGNGSQRTFTFPFEYLETTDVKVAQYVDDNLKYVDLTYGTDWRFLNPTTVEVVTPPTTSLVIYRCTDLDQMQATFHPGHSVKADDLNTDFNQLRLAIEEGRCGRGYLQDELQYGKELWLNRINADDEEDGLKGDLVKSNSKLTIDDEHVATTQWIDNRYWDQCEETTETSDRWVDEIDDVHVPTTGAVEARLTELKLLSDVSTVTGKQQRAKQWDESVTDDKHVATTDALVERHDTYVNESNEEFEENRYTQPGKFWVKDDENILFYRRDSGSAWIQINTKGERGEQGPIGPEGPQGNDGNDGSNGIDGNDGADGNLCTLGDNPPTDPLVGDTWFNTDCPVGMYVWTGVQWVGTSTPGPAGPEGSKGSDGNRCSLGDNPPANPLVGDTWFDTVCPVGMYVWTGTEWVGTSTPGPPGKDGTGSGPTYTFLAPLVEVNDEVSFSWTSLTALS
jgi:hypothetical protein